MLSAECVCVYVRHQTPLAASVSLLDECVWERERLCLPTGQRQTHARESRAVPSFSPCAVFSISRSMVLLNLAVKPISLASYATAKPQRGSKLSAATWINSNAGFWYPLFCEDTLWGCIAQQSERLLACWILFIWMGEDCISAPGAHYLSMNMFSCNTVKMHISWDTILDL